MPVFDMPLDQLKKYQGINPRPRDFDLYWERAIQEMNESKSELELIPANFQAPFADCFDLYFTGVRGARIHAKYLRPKNNAPHPALLQFHGYTMDSGDWIDKLPYVAAGFAVFAMDCRGQGGLSEDTGGVKGNTHHGHIIRGLDDEPDNLLYRHIFLDTAQLASIVMNLPEVDPKRIGAMGGSQGGALTIACASLVPEIKRLAPVYPFLADYKRVWEMDLAKDAYGELKEYFRRFDPRHERENEIYTKLGYIDIQNLADRIKGKVLMATGLMDMICPPSTQFAVYNKITAEKEMKIYPDFAHEHLPGFADICFKFMMKLVDSN
ncbi:acetylxylan esterase [Natronospora cellulosivora (SeqCode)]